MSHPSAPTSPPVSGGSPGDRRGAERRRACSASTSSASPLRRDARRARRPPRPPRRRARSASPASARRRTSSAPSVPSASADSRMNVPGRPARERAVQADGRDVVGEQPADHGDDPAVRGQPAERRRATATCRPRGPPPRWRPWARCGAVIGVSSGASASPTTAGSGPPASKQVRAPVWQAAPTWSTSTSSASPSQSMLTALTYWRVARRVALAPVLLARAAPERHAAGRQRAVQRLVVHPAEHEHLARVVLLHDAATRPCSSRLRRAATAGSRVGAAGILDRRRDRSVRQRAATVPGAGPRRPHRAASARLRHPGAVHRRVVRRRARRGRRGARPRRRGPRSTTTTVSAASAVDSRCAIVRVLRPRVSESSARAIRTSVAGSTADVASSSRSRSRAGEVGARERDQLPLPRRQRLAALPDGRVEARRRARRPTRPGRARRRPPARGRRRVGAASAVLVPQAVRHVLRRACRRTGTPPAAPATTRRRSSATAMSRRSTPSSSTAPCVGSMKRATSRAIVVLPDPVAPTTATEVPAGIVTSTSCSTGGPSGYAKSTSRSSTRGRAARADRTPSGPGVDDLDRRLEHAEHAPPARRPRSAAR